MRSIRLFLTFTLAGLLGVELLHVLPALLAHAHQASMVLSLNDLHVKTAGPAIDTIVGFATAPSTTLTALTMASGDSLAIRNCDRAKRVSMIQMWGDWQTAGYAQVRSPNFHDNVRGIQVRGSAASVLPLMPFERDQRVFANDTLAAYISGSATGGDIESLAMQFYYEDLPGISARFISPDELQKRGVNVVSVENTLALGTAGGWSGAEAINAETDLLKANRDYALVGLITDTEAVAIAVRGPDTGNLRVGVPGNPAQKHVTENWFVRMSRYFNLPLIPVINSNNKGGTQVDGAQDENGADPIVNTIWVELAPA